MRSLSRNRKGAVVDIVLNPLFVTAVALVVIGGFILRNAYTMGEATELQKAIYATDVAFNLDSLYSVRKDVNFFVEYPVLAKFGIKIGPKLVTVYETKPEDGKIFWFNEDRGYDFVYGEFKPKRKTPAIRFFKEGNKLGVLKRARINFATPMCEERLHTKRTAVADYTVLASLGQQPVDIVTGEVLITADASQGIPSLTIYVNSNPESAQMACEIAQELFKTLPLKEYAIMPLNPELLGKDDTRLTVAQSKDLSAYVYITLPQIDSTEKGAISQAVSTGVEDFVV